MRHFNLFILTSITMLSATNAGAAIYKGQKVYVRDCRSCHPSEQVISASRTKGTWDALMNEHGKMLSDLHLASAEAELSWAYFNSAKYKKESRHLHDFFVEYAKDSGNVLASE